MLRLNISQESAQIAITTRNASPNLTTTPPKLNMETEPAIVEISQPNGELTIDSTAFRASYGIKTYAQFARDNAEMSHQAVLEGIGRIAGEGDRLARIDTGENAIRNIAADNFIQEAPGITLAPLAAPEISYNARPPQFNPIPGKLSISVEQGTVQNNYQPAEVDISMARYPSIRMWTTGSRLSIMA